MAINGKTDRSWTLRTTHRIQHRLKFHLFYNSLRLALGYKLLPILMYHSVGEPTIHRYNLSLAAFERQMRFISTHCRLIRLKDVPTQLASNKQQDQRIPLAVTFDDGYKNLYEHIHPVMERMEIPYTVFIPTAFIGSYALWDADRLPLLNSREMKVLATSRLVDFGSHSNSHLSLTRLSSSELKKELTQSKKQLEKIISRRVEMFAYPYGTFGHYSNRIAAAVAESGYRLAVTACFNAMNRANNNYKLRRIFFTEEDNASIMKIKITGACDWYLYAVFFDFLLTRFASKSRE